MAIDVNYFKNEILTRKPQLSHGYTEYGSKVMPVLEYYKSLTDSKSRNLFYDALKQLLESENKHEREFAVSICLGFFVFRNAL